jgi:hypothetical protein
MTLIDILCLCAVCFVAGYIRGYIRYAEHDAFMKAPTTVTYSATEDVCI